MAINRPERRNAITGELFDAATLARWGLLDAVTTVENRDAVATARAADYAALPPISVQTIKRSINRYAGALDEAIMHAALNI